MKAAIITEEEYDMLMSKMQEFERRTAFAALIPNDVPDWASRKDLQRIKKISYKKLEGLVEARVVRRSQDGGSVVYSKHDYVEYIYNNIDTHHYLKTA